MTNIDTPRIVPNLFPRVEPTAYRLAVIGDAPGQDEELSGQPFVGSSGRLLRAVLSSFGLVEAQIFFGNVCQIRPPSNEIEALDWTGPEITHGLNVLANDLARFRPNCILLLGRSAFRAFRPDLCYPSKDEYYVPLSNWRGSIFKSTAVGDYKCVATYHPAYILRTAGDIAYFKFDARRAMRQSTFPDLQVVVREGIITPTINQVVDFFRDLRATRRPASCDIEGYANDLGITSISVAPSPTSGIVVPLWTGGTHYWTEEDELVVWREVSGWLADAECPKRMHNAFYENFVLPWRHKILIRGIIDDTMMKGWEIAPELERSLAVNVSFYSEEPYYKDERTSSDPQVKLAYNFKDSACTEEVSQNQEAVLVKTPTSHNHYRFNVNLIPPDSYIMLGGCKFDVARAEALARETEIEVAQLNAEIESAVGREFNVKSTPDKQWLLYDLLGCEPLKRYGKSTKEDVLLHYWAKTKNPLIRLVIRCVRKRTRLSDIHKLVPFLDGRIRSSYDLVGTNTGRISSRSSQALKLVYSKSGIPSWEETGTNLQNVTKDLRVCFIPDDENFVFWQCDLAGADAWTVAADLAALGHNAMLDDLLYGIKPSLVLLAMLAEYEAGRDAAKINLLPRDELKRITKAIKKDFDDHAGVKLPDGRDYDWKYLCAKRVQHGSNYDMQPPKLSETIFGDSDGVIDLSPRDAGLYQYFYKLRYKTDKRNDWIRAQLSQYGYLTAACGIRRQFYGIRNRRDVDDASVREASAFEPQANTTWATNMALYNLHMDPENRTSRNTFFIEPLLHVHDALAGQFRRSHLDWARQKLKTWFNNPLKIHGIDVTIPADGGFGPNWKDCKESL